jgi:hypothetical protein
MPSRPSLFGSSQQQLTEDAPVIFLQGDVGPLHLSVQDAFQHFRNDFDHLPEDRWLKSDYVFRRRRFSTFSIDTKTRCLTKLARRSFYQTVEINSYAGGVERHFEPLEDRTARNSFLHQLICDIYDVLPETRTSASRHWEIGVHLVRIIAHPGKPGHPAPEGMHRDGHAFTSITLVKRSNIEGGVSRFARKDGSIYCERAMLEPLETVVFDDGQGLHDVTSVTSGRTDMGIRDICGFSFNPM